MREYNTTTNERDQQKSASSLDANAKIALTFLILIAIGLAGYIALARFHIRPEQIMEAFLYLLILGVMAYTTIRYLFTRRAKREKSWPHPPVNVPALKDHANVLKAFEKDSIVLGYDAHGEPVLWSDEVRRMQSILIGKSGFGKTTLLRNIIGQDARRAMGSPDRPRHMPMFVLGGKGDREFPDSLLHDFAAAGRLQDVRLLDPSRPDLSVRLNPLAFDVNDSYEDYVNAVFESFGLREDFFKGHQANYFSDLVRVLVHTGKRINIYDVLVAAFDPLVLKDQIAHAMYRAEHEPGVTMQKRLNLRMSAQNLLQSLQDQERVTKIQGLLNSSG